MATVNKEIDYYYNYNETQSHINILTEKSSLNPWQ